MSAEKKPAFVLVHGAWHGAWCWHKVEPLLRAQGHEVFVVCLTGVGERAHLMSPSINLATHIQDVVAQIDCAELEQVILVGHSYGGMVITGVADALLKRGHHPLERLVYVDAVVPKSGESWSSCHTPEMIASRVSSAKASGMLSLPVGDSKDFGLMGVDREWVNRRMTPQPFALYQEPLLFDEDRVRTLDRTYIDCNFPALKSVEVIRERVRRENKWQVIELKTGHDPMISAPNEFTEILLGLKT